MSSIYVRFGTLPIYRSDQIQDFQKSGYFNNWQLSALAIPYNILASFRTPPVNNITATIAEFKAEKIGIKGGIITVYETIDLTTNNIETETLTSTRYFYRQQQTIYDENFLDLYCVYRLYLEDSNGTAWYSNIFITVEEDDLFITTEGGLGLLIEGGVHAGETILFQP